jgi:AcrR family transcriptional regulator
MAGRAGKIGDPVGRISQIERRRRTKEKLFRAAVDILVEHGFNSLTLDMVSQRAGVSRGAQTNYYPTKRELLIATSRQMIEEGSSKALQFPNAEPSEGKVLDAFLNEAVRFFLGHHFQAMIDLYVAARHDKALSAELVELQLDARRKLDSIWLKRFRSAGRSGTESKDIIEFVNNFLRGAAYLACIQNRSVSEHEIKRWVALLHRHFDIRK